VVPPGVEPGAVGPPGVGAVVPDVGGGPPLTAVVGVDEEHAAVSASRRTAQRPAIAS
jgi:hypothetical protein